jgi:hypothetical protein
MGHQAQGGSEPLRQVESSLAVQNEEGFFDELHSLVDIDPAPGLAALMMAVSEYADCLRNRPLGPQEVLGIMSSCYEAILRWGVLGGVTAVAVRVPPRPGPGGVPVADRAVDGPL